MKVASLSDVCRAVKAIEPEATAYEAFMVDGFVVRTRRRLDEVRRALVGLGLVEVLHETEGSHRNRVHVLIVEPA